MLDAGKLDKRYAQLMPEATVVLKTSTRLLKLEGGELVACGADDHPNGWGHLAAHNQMWLQASEIAQLRELDGEGPVDLPSPIAYRLMRFHLVDNTRGEPDFWSRQDVREYQLSLRTPPGEPLRRVIEGHVLLENGKGRGFEAKVLGQLDIAPDAYPPDCG